MNTSATLNYEDWSALEAAEAPLYAGDPGAHAYTDVTPREDGQKAATLWEIVKDGSAIEHYFEGDQYELREEIARRVAAMLAIAAFGVDFIAPVQA